MTGNYSAKKYFEEPSPVPASQDFALAAPVIQDAKFRNYSQEAPGKVSASVLPVVSPHIDPVIGYVWQAKPTDTAAIGGAPCGESWRSDADWTPLDLGPSYADAVPETDGFKTLKWVYYLKTGTYSQATLTPGPLGSTDVVFIGLKHRGQYMLRCCAYTARGYGAWSLGETVSLAESPTSTLIPGIGGDNNDWKALARILSLSIRDSNESWPGHIRAYLPNPIPLAQQSTAQDIVGYKFQWRRIEEWGDDLGWVDCTNAVPINNSGSQIFEPSDYYILEGIPKNVRVEVRAFTKTVVGNSLVAIGSGEHSKSFAEPTEGPAADTRPVPQTNWPVYDNNFTCVNYGLRWVALEESQSRSLYFYRDSYSQYGSTAGAPCDMQAPIAFFATGGSMPAAGRLVHLGRTSTGIVDLATADDHNLNWISHPLPTPPSNLGTTIDSSKIAHQALCWNPVLNKFLIGVMAVGNPYSAAWLATAPADLSSWTVVRSWTGATAIPISGPHALFPAGDKFWNMTDGRYSSDGVTWSSTTTPSEFRRFAGHPRQEHTDGKWIVEANYQSGSTMYLTLMESVDLSSWDYVDKYYRIRSDHLSSGVQSDQIRIPGGSTNWESIIGRRPLYNGNPCMFEGWVDWTNKDDGVGNMIWNGVRMVGAQYTQGPDLTDTYSYADMPTPPPECGDDWWCHFPILRSMPASSAISSSPTGKYVLRGFTMSE